MNTSSVIENIFLRTIACYFTLSTSKYLYSEYSPIYHFLYIVSLVFWSHFKSLCMLQGFEDVLLCFHLKALLFFFLNSYLDLESVVVIFHM